MNDFINYYELLGVKNNARKEEIRLKYKEQIIHHMAVNILQPIFKHGMYEHSYGSIPNRGAHKRKKLIKK